MVLCLIGFVSLCAVLLLILFLVGFLKDDMPHDFGQGWAEWPPKSEARCSRCGGIYAALANCGGLDRCDPR